MKKTVLDKQSLLDIALQECGDITAVFELADLNGVVITDDLQTGRGLVMPPVAVNRQVVSYYDAHGIRPATGIAGDFVPDGVEFWGIEIDFMVS